MINENRDRMMTFVKYASELDGYEKGEAQVFCDRLFQAFGHKGYKEAGATLESKVKKSASTSYADLLWDGRVLLEMKSRGEALEKHYTQAFDYWVHLVPDRPRYVVLCNFDEFWIYDFNNQVDVPVDKVDVGDLPDRYTALNFLFASDPRPTFGNDRVSVTRKAADKVASIFNALVDRGESRDEAQRFALQCVVAMFGEDYGLLPKDLFANLVEDCVKGESSHDLIGGLFRQMGEAKKAKAGRYSEVQYFNGGLFDEVYPMELKPKELTLLHEAASENWAQVAPPIFGTLFQSSLDKGTRHALGAHFTNEADIQEIVRPTIVVPWTKRIEKAKTLTELRKILDEIQKFRVLDPACGSGNFLYVAYKELVKLELSAIRKIHDNFGKKAREKVGAYSLVSVRQFHGIDIDPFAVELAKVTLMLAKRIAAAESMDEQLAKTGFLPLEYEKPLPLDNLDSNIVSDDALFCDWPTVDVIVGNPPYQSKNKMQSEYGAAYVNSVRKRYPKVPGNADYCVYWIRRAHDELADGCRAGLVGTNTIRQNYSRQGGLDYVVSNGGTIEQAWSTKVWSGDAIVHVSIVNWIKGESTGKKVLFRQDGDSLSSPLTRMTLDYISPSLSGGVDVTRALDLACNSSPKSFYQGQTHGHGAFLLSPSDAVKIVMADTNSEAIVFPFLIGEELLSGVPAQVERYVIDFGAMNVLEAKSFVEPFKIIQSKVLPAREAAAERESQRNAAAKKEDPSARVNKHHANFLNRWWQLSYRRGELMARLKTLPRFIACVRTTKRPIFVFLPTAVHPNDALQVFAFDDDYSFGILQSAIHWEWFVERCSTLKGDFRYTSNTVYKTFPWPQAVTNKEAIAIAKAARALRELRRELMIKHGLSLRELYRSLEESGAHPMKDCVANLNEKVRAAYGMKKRDNVLEFLFKLNQAVAAKEKKGEKVFGPGIPPKMKKLKSLYSSDTDLEWNGF